jgi:hypothetical protein
MKAKCGHIIRDEEISCVNAHYGLCRRCHSNFVFLVELEGQYGKDALIEYWFAMILSNLSEDRQKTDCFLNHMIEYYQGKLTKVSSSHDYSYLQKMLYMLHSLQKPNNENSLV